VANGSRMRLFENCPGSPTGSAHQNQATYPLFLQGESSPGQSAPTNDDAPLLPLKPEIGKTGRFKVL
jgi:hypothetical protein